MIEIIPDQTTHEQLQNRIRLLSMELELLKSQLDRSNRFGLEVSRALTAAEKRENELIDRIREGL